MPMQLCNRARAQRRRMAIAIFSLFANFLLQLRLFWCGGWSYQDDGIFINKRSESRQGHVCHQNLQILSSFRLNTNVLLFTGHHRNFPAEPHQWNRQQYRLSRHRPAAKIQTARLRAPSKGTLSRPRSSGRSRPTPWTSKTRGTSTSFPSLPT